MKAMVLEKLCNLKENQMPLELMELPVPVLREQEILLKVSACGVCHIELDEIEGANSASRITDSPGTSSDRSSRSRRQQSQCY
jgi:propanol-preferring alcohol dehydrogenase